VGNALSGSFGAGLGGLARFLPAMAAGTGAVNAVKVSVDRKRAAMALAAVSSEDLGDQMDRLRELAKDPALGFDQVVAGTTRLQAVGFSAEQSEAAIREMGNALALVGGGKEQLDGVLLALTQIVAKGTVSAEEINQIAERLPQIRSLMVEAFGTSDTTMLQEMKLGAEEFVNGVVEAASKLERAQATSASAISNLGDEWKNLMQTIGDTVEPVLGPVLGLMSKLIAMAGDVIQVTASAVSTVGFEAGLMLEGLSPEQRAEARRIAAEPGSAASGQKAEADGKGTGSEATQAELFAKKAAREKALKEQEALSEKLADQREAQIVRDREKRAREREQDQREVEGLRERASAGEFLLKSPEEQAKQLRDQLSQSLDLIFRARRISNGGSRR
jgi:tape measure domain-containing protein